ncbi:MAG: hypothetical protein FWC54_01495 [Actinomycetia bacterium]|nr:hypothetical protein [Actinomycetes bacterium]
MKTLFSLLAMACSLSGGVVYVVSVLRGHARPQRITWLLWAILGVVYLLSALRSQGNVIYTFASFIGPFTIFLLALKYGVGGTSRLDLVSLAIAVFALVLLMFTKRPILSILLCLFVDAIGAFLTINKILKDRSSEPRIMWFLSALGGAFALLGLHDYRLENLLFPTYILILGLITFTLVRSPQKA